MGCRSGLGRRPASTERRIGAIAAPALSACLGLLALVLAAQAALAQDWQAGARPEWQGIVAKAKQEGSVGVAGHPALGKALAEAFERDTGIKLQYVGGPTNEIASRLEREVVANNVTLDVFLGGPGGYHELRERGE